jgi:hypothetical protein
MDPPKNPNSVEMVKELITLKEKREKLLKEFKFLRSRIRFPMSEALYAGKWELVQVRSLLQLL